MNAQYDHAPKSKSNHDRMTNNENGIAMPSTVLVHAKLEMTTPGDSDEQEADEMADSIVNGEKIARSVSTGHSGGGIALPSQFGSQLASLQGLGSRLYGDLKRQMETGFGRDFSNVRLHTDEAAAEMSSSISARAFTYGNDIFFNRGQYSPYTRDGQHLIAHELAHIAQRTGMINRKVKNDIGLSEREEKLDFIRLFSTDRNRLDADHVANQADDEIKKRLNETKPHCFYTYMWLYRKSVNDYISSSEDTIIRSQSGNIGYVNVVIRLSLASDRNLAFIDEDYSSLPNLIILQEIDSVSTCTELLKSISDVIGPIQNLVISGHGSWKSIALSPNHSFSVEKEELPASFQEGFELYQDNPDQNETMNFFKVVGDLMPEKEGVEKRIFFDACLTDSHRLQRDRSEFNIAEIARIMVGWNNPRNLIAADASSSGTSYSFNNNALYVDDEQAPHFLHYYTVLREKGTYYAGIGANEPLGHFCGICMKFINTRDARILMDDLSFFHESFIVKYPTRKGGKIASKILEEIDHLRSAILMLSHFDMVMNSDVFFYTIIEHLYNLSENLFEDRFDGDMFGNNVIYRGPWLPR